MILIGNSENKSRNRARKRELPSFAMDINEILKFKQGFNDKRVIDRKTSDPENRDENSIERKKLKLSKSEGDENVQMEEFEQDCEELDEVNESSIKRTILTLEKKMESNRNHRVRFSETPEKFMESEFLLFEEITKLKIFATCPEFYSLLISLDFISLMLNLLTHENIDICVVACEVIGEMLDVFNEPEHEYIEMFASHLATSTFFSTLIGLLNRVDIDRDSNSNAIKTVLDVFHALYDIRPEFFTSDNTTELMRWILNYLQRKTFVPNKGSSSELLVIFLQESDDIRKIFGENQGFDVILTALSIYRNSNPKVSEEKEHMENLFDSLCSALLYSANKKIFVASEGIQLMVLFLREKLQSCFGALKVLSYCLSGDYSQDACVKFVEVLGLRSFFPIFMYPYQPRCGLTEKYTVEEHCCTIISSLLRHSSGLYRKRILQKFVEDDHIKVDRLMEIYINYLELMKKVDAILPKNQESIDIIADINSLIDPNSNINPEEQLEHERFSKKMDKGLFTLFQAVYVIFELLVCGVLSIRDRILFILKQRRLKTTVLRSFLREYQKLLFEPSKSHQMNISNNEDSNKVFCERLDYLQRVFA